MPHTSSTRPPRRSNAEYRWSRPRIHLFLRALAAGGSVAAAARVVGVSRQSAYRLRRRLGPDFAAVWEEGLQIGAEMRQAGLRYDAQGDTWVPQGDRQPAQSDTFSRQGDTASPKVTGFSSGPCHLCQPGVTL
ncbi:helix-turn-helix domain-containing protein [Novosphingobium mangrovi (ex Huang et al. 2023)]|uniref:helix-turn-helix domain-containing protein n=1 Tax=Novosphingobium mangrovi (ex Huang et al. 2023) TaxID=2976432 RepID=UPI002E22C043